MSVNKKNVRLSEKSYNKLKVIKFYTEESFISIITEAIDQYYDKLKIDGKIKDK